MFSNWTRRPDSRTHTCRHLKTSHLGEAGVSDRQERVPGFDQARLSSATIMLIGAGGLNGEVAECLARKGVGHLIIFDGDVVEPSNLNRQLFTHRDLYKNKALCLAKNLSSQGFLGTKLTGQPHDFQDAQAKGVDMKADIYVCGVDNDATRFAVARHAHEQGKPATFSAVSEDANAGYVFIQEPGGPCFQCVFGPIADQDDEAPCPGTPAIKDILKTLGGLTAYAIDTLLMPRQRTWNYRQVFMNGNATDVTTTQRIRPECTLCGG